MRASLIGADFEENLGIGMVAASAELAGHLVKVHAFDHPEGVQALARELVDEQPDVVGLGMQFQHRAREFLTLATALRELGYQGHITCGGQFPTLAWEPLLTDRTSLDSVVLHEGEHAFAELLDALDSGADLEQVPGLALRIDGQPKRTATRPLVDLDSLPFPKRYRAHSLHLGVPFIPIMGSRGCWGSCAYCAITSFYRDARAHGGGRTYRLRSPRDVAAEMAVLWHHAGGQAIFCFHDDNLLLPRPEKTLERLRAIRAELDGFGVGRIGIVGKARPDTLTEELALQLAELGVIRLYVGVENASVAGGEHLGRGRQQACIRQALAACRKAGIFCCYNLLVFEPDASLDDVRTNIAFIREHAEHPVNFCRAEPYSGTPLQKRLQTRGSLNGSYLGWNYRIEDPRTETLFRVCAAAFRERNFACDGVANRAMGLGYAVKVLEHFHGHAVEGVAARGRRLTAQLERETADFLEQAVQLVEETTHREHIERATVALGLRIAQADQHWQRELTHFYRDCEAMSQPASRTVLQPPHSLARLTRAVVLTASLMAVAGCKSCHDDPPVVDPVVEPIDPVPPDPVPMDSAVLDPALDPIPPDPLPPDIVVDPVPAPIEPKPPEEPIPMGDPPPPELLKPVEKPADDAEGEQGALFHWRDTAPRRSPRTPDLPLYSPPDVTLVAQAEGDGLRVQVCGGPRLSVRWEAEGRVASEGREALWHPLADDEQLRVAVRSAGGVAVLSLRANQV